LGGSLGAIGSLNIDGRQRSRPNTVADIGAKRVGGRLKPIRQNSHIVRAQAIMNPPVGSAPIGGKHEHFTGGHDTGDTCTPSVRTCVSCHQVDVEHMRSTYQKAVKANREHSTRVPVLFMSMGDVMHTMDPQDPTHKRLAQVGSEIAAEHKIRVVLLVSACWTTDKRPCLTAAPDPVTMHEHPCQCLMDFEYPVPGCPHITKQIRKVLVDGGLQCTQDNKRGIDHGAWVAMHCLFPDPDQAPPVVQLSLINGYDTAEHLNMGKLLDPLRDEGVLIVGVGNAVSSRKQFELSFIKQYKMAYFRATNWSQETRDKQHLIPIALKSVADWAEEFDIWLACLLESTTGEQRNAMVCEYRRHPLAALAHPTPEMITPLIVVLGAASLGGEGSDCTGRKIHGSFQHSLSLSAFRFG